MELNLYKILTEQLLTEDRVSKIQSKVRKIIMASNPNTNWNEQITNHNGKIIPYIQDVINSFISKIFGHEFANANMELAPHAAEIAFNQLNFIENPNSSDISRLKKIIHYISANLNNETLQSFNSSNYEQLVETYGEIINQIKLDKRNDTALITNQNGYNGYTIQQIDHFEESENFYTYTKNLETPWCLTHMRDMFNYYGSNGKDKIYFIFHEGFENIQNIPNEKPTWDVPKIGEAPYDAYGYSLICIIVDENGDLTYCTPRWNHEYGHTDDFLDEKAITQLIHADFFQVFKPYTLEEIEERTNSEEFGEEDWYNYLITRPSDGYEVGYFKEGTLYDINRNEIANGYWDNWQALHIGDGGMVIEHGSDDNFDVFRCKNGEIEKAYSNVKQITYVDDYVERYDQLGILLGIDGDEDFIICNMDNWYEDSVQRGIISYKYLESDFYLLKYDDNKHYGVANINNECIEIIYGIIDPSLEFDYDNETIYFWEYEKDYDKPLGDGKYEWSWKRKSIGFYASEGDWEYDEDYEEEDVPFYKVQTENINSKKILSNFKTILDKLNEIHKRNTPLQLN